MTLIPASVSRPVLAGLIDFHILIIIASNYLVQLPITLFGWHTTWGAFSFPFIFLATDLTVRLLGKRPARLVIARVMIPALLASYVISVIFQEGAFRGFASLGEFNTFVARISLASFLAYVFGQILDIQIFDRLRRMRQWWIAPVVSTLFGNLLDTFTFFSIAQSMGRAQSVPPIGILVIVATTSSSRWRGEMVTGTSLSENATNS